MCNAGNGRMLCVFCNLQRSKWLSTCLLKETAFPPLSGFHFGSLGCLTCCGGRKGSNDEAISSRVSLFWNIFAFHQGSSWLRWLLIKWQKREKLSGSIYYVSLCHEYDSKAPLWVWWTYFWRFLRPKYSQANQISS